MADEKKTLLPLHYLRGICAAGVMVFHFTSSAYGRYSAGDFLGRFGVYAVSVFYILSGITLYHVYYRGWTGGFRPVVRFYWKRILRIYPLLWLSSLLLLCFEPLLLSPLQTVFYFTGLFGFIQWDFSINPVGWSIGNELVFYALFPVMVWLARKRKWVFGLYVLIFLACYIWFAFWKVTEGKSLPELWPVYTNPLNHYFLFIAGFLIGYLSGERRWHPVGTGMGFVALWILFALIPVKGDPAVIIHGWHRMIFTALSIGICLVAFKWRFQAPGVLHRVLYHFGNISYSVYLLHPVIWMFLDDFVNPRLVGSAYEMGPATRIMVALLGTLLLSGWVYRWFETPFIRWGKKRATKVSGISS